MPSFYLFAQVVTARAKNASVNLVGRWSEWGAFSGWPSVVALDSVNLAKPAVSKTDPKADYLFSLAASQLACKFHCPINFFTQIRGRVCRWASNHLDCTT